MKTKLTILLVISSVLSLLIPMKVVAYTPDCDDCEYWDGYDCVLQYECASPADCGGCCGCYSCYCYDVLSLCTMNWPCTYCDDCACECAEVTSISSVSSSYYAGQTDSYIRANTSHSVSSGCEFSWSGGAWIPGNTQTVSATFNTPGEGLRIYSSTNCQWGAIASSAFNVVAVDKIQYYCYVSAQWVDITGTLYINKGDHAQFKAKPNPYNVSWPSGKPVWGGSSGASGTGSTTDVTFSTLSSSSTNYKTVTATCGNTITVNVIVYDFDGTLSPNVTFTGRSMTTYGLEEKVGLGCNIIPTGISASQVGGLRWKMPSGVGTLSNVSSNGTAVYDAGAVAGGVPLWLEVMSGPSWGAFKSYNRTIVAPSDINFVQKPGTGVAHDYGVSSAGFKGEFYLRPTNVSFSYLTYGEGETEATLVGWYSSKFPSGLTHPANGPIFISAGNITNGCKVLGVDTVFDWASSPPSFSWGYMNWLIPERYHADTGSWEYITFATHRGDIDSAGKKTIQKAGVGPFSKNLYDPTSGY